MNMRPRTLSSTLLRALGLFLLLLGTVGVAEQTTLPLPTTSIVPSENWLSGRLANSPHTVGRAATAEKVDSPAILILDTSQDTCGIWQFTVLIPHQRLPEKAAAPDIAARAIVGGQSWDMRLRETKEQGVARLRLQPPTPPDETLVEAMRRGKQLRLELFTNDSPQFFLFTLRGFTEAAARATRICTGAERAPNFFPPQF